jgi:DNA-binding beta-propeller fold protein YncE
MTRLLREIVLAVLCVSQSPGALHAATQAVLGRSFRVSDPDGNGAHRKIEGRAMEKRSSGIIVGNPAANGASLQVVAQGGADFTQTFMLPSTGWRAAGSTGFKYSNASVGGAGDFAVRRASIKRTADGKFEIGILILGRDGPVAVIPPNPGAAGGFILTLAGGDSYCVGFGGAAGGTEVVNDGRTWFIEHPDGAACPEPSQGTTTTTLPSAGVAHYEYVFPDGAFYVYDMDHGHQLVKTVPLSHAQGIRGVVAHAGTHSLYISYGGDGDGQNGTPTLLKYDLLTDAVVWTHSYAIGVDSMSVTPDGSLIYLPSGELASGGTWYVIRTDTGAVATTINGPQGPHNTIVNLAGTRVYLGGRADSYLGIADTATNQVVSHVGPFQSSVRPFTINGRETLAYVTVTGLRGFQIGDIASGQVLRTVTFSGPNVSTLNGPSAPSHGISLSPDEREVYVVDWPDYVHVFDVSGVPAQAPRQVADIPLTPSMNHDESPCLYDCLADGWLQHSRDGRFVFVADQGDVIDTVTRGTVANLAPLYNTRKMIEIDWSEGVPVFAATARSSVGYVQ